MGIRGLEVKGLSPQQGVRPLQTSAYYTGLYYDPLAELYYYAQYNAATGRIDVYEWTAQGYVYATSWVPAPKCLEVTVGDKLRIYADFYYTGPEFTGELYGAIGTHGIGFDEKTYNVATLSLPQCLAETHFTNKYVDVQVKNVLGWHYYSIYIKARDGIGNVISPYYEDALLIVGVEPEFTEFKIYDFVKV